MAIFESIGGGSGGRLGSSRLGRTRNGGYGESVTAAAERYRRSPYSLQHSK